MLQTRGSDGDHLGWTELRGLFERRNLLFSSLSCFGEEILHQVSGDCDPGERPPPISAKETPRATEFKDRRRCRRVRDRLPTLPALHRAPPVSQPDSPSFLRHACRLAQSAQQGGPARHDTYLPACVAWHELAHIWRSYGASIRRAT